MKCSSEMEMGYDQSAHIFHYIDLEAKGFVALGGGGGVVVL